MEEKATHIKSKRALFIVLMILLFLPLMQHVFNPFHQRPLNGAVTANSPADFSLKIWLDGDYQDQTTKYLNENFGFRNFCVRLYNQVSYSFFNEARANGVVIGKAGYLFEKPYIDAYTGKDFLGDEHISKQVIKFAQMRDSLNSHQVNIAVVLTPGKAAFYPEYIPDHFLSDQNGKTNLESYLREFTKNQIHHIDLHSWFIKQKPTSPYRLYPKGGTHWSSYGEVLATDTILKFIEKIEGVRIPELIIDTIATSTSMKNRDEDIEQGMNLLFNPEDLEMAYPSIYFKKTESTVQPKVLVIADSYYWGLVNLGVNTEVFDSGTFWYYGRQIHPERDSLPNDVQEINVQSAVEEFELVLFLLTDASLSKFPFGVIDRLYDAYVEGNPEPKPKLSYEEKMAFYIASIKALPDWFEKVEMQANENGISLEKALEEEAAYMVWKDESGMH